VELIYAFHLTNSVEALNRAHKPTVFHGTSDTCTWS